MKKDLIYAFVVIIVISVGTAIYAFFNESNKTNNNSSNDSIDTCLVDTTVYDTITIDTAYME